MNSCVRNSHLKKPVLHTKWHQLVEKQYKYFYVILYYEFVPNIVFSMVCCLCIHLYRVQ